MRAAGRCPTATLRALETTARDAPRSPPRSPIGHRFAVTSGQIASGAVRQRPTHSSESPCSWRAFADSVGTGATGLEPATSGVTGEAAGTWQLVQSCETPAHHRFLSGCRNYAQVHD